MTTDLRATTATGAGGAAAFDPERLEELWAQVPAEFRVWSYDLHQAPFDRVLGGTRARRVELDVAGLTESVRRELAWWVWSGPVRNNRRVRVDALLRLLEAVRELPDGSALSSLVELDPAVLLKAYRASFHRRLHRLPCAGLVKDFTIEVRLLQAALDRAYSPLPWWCQDVWSPRLDPRIAVRTHEPLAGQSLSFLRIRQAWLREALKYFAHVSLETGALTWGSLLSRVCHIGVYLDEFITERQLTGPALVERPEEQLRPVMVDFLGWLRARPRTCGRVAPGGTPGMSAMTVRQTQSSVRTFYEFLVDHRRELAAASGDPRFLEVSAAHLRLWRPADAPRTRRRVNPAGYIEDGDLAQMIEHVAILGLARDQTAQLTIGGMTRTVAGLGDPSGMRAWLIQALTGRRANEILMLDHNPLLPVPGLDHRAVNDADGGDREFVAKLRYQQTKIEGAPDTILVGPDVVALIHEQQAWLREHLPAVPGDPEPRYLFPALNHNPRGIRHRPLGGYHASLQKLTRSVGLVDRQGRALEFSKSHRLRHTKATTLLNLGVPLPVLMRYLGHTNPTMTLYYGQTLAETAEREFLRARKLGHDGRELEISPSDVYDVIALSARTDRVLPTGVCLLPPTKRCDRGNACYSCTHFATDSTFLDAHRELLTATERLIEQRKAQHQVRTGRPMTDDNVWLSEQNATVTTLRNIIARLETIGPATAVKGAGTRTTPGPVPLELTQRPEARAHG